MASVSITIPTLFPDLIRGCVNAIYKNTNPTLDFEIVVVCPFKVTGPRIVWVKEEEMRGNNAAFRSAYEASRGDWFVALADDHHVQPGWLESILRFAEARESIYFPYVCGLHQYFSLGTIFGLYYAFFPFMSRRSIERIGGWYNPTLKSQFGDSDMSLRVWEAGGRAEVCFASRIASIPNRQAFPEAPLRSGSRSVDYQTFIERWSPVFGNGWSTDHLRDFNLDVPMTCIDRFLSNNSITRNDLQFRAELLEEYKKIPDNNFLEWN